MALKCLRAPPHASLRNVTYAQDVSGDFKMTKEQIQATGNLLATYYSDSTYIRDFNRYKQGYIRKADYLHKSQGTFKSFIDEFRVARNADKNKTSDLLTLTLKWVNASNANNVDDFANLLKQKGITHGKVMTSLASKILFLNNPWTILPLDNLAKKAVGLKSNIYSDYLPLVDDFKQHHKKEINNCLALVDEHLSIIEKDFKNEINNMKTVRSNRFTDKLLWTLGRQKQKLPPTSALRKWRVMC